VASVTAKCILEDLLTRDPGRTDLDPLAVGLFRFPHDADRKVSVPPNPERRRAAIWRSGGVSRKSIPISSAFNATSPALLLHGRNAAADGGQRRLRFYGNSIEISKRLVERHPKNTQNNREFSQFCSKCASFYGIMNDLARELEWQERATAVDPLNRGPYNRLAWRLANLRDSNPRDVECAFVLVGKAAEIDPREANTGTRPRQALERCHRCARQIR
jgi:hypothetical protein